MARNNAVKEWNIEEIRFFDPNYEGTRPVINVGKHVFYKEVYVFIDWYKNMALLKRNNKLHTVLLQCFHGAALIWHFTELSEMEKILFWDTNLVGWYKAMIHYFKKCTLVTLASLQKARYTMSDAKDWKDLRSFV